MMFDGKKDNAFRLYKVEQEVDLRNIFTKLVRFPHHPIQFLDQYVGLYRSERMDEEETPGPRKPAEGWNDVVEKMIEQSLIRGRPV